MHRLYENDDITVFWDSDKCFHAKRCVGGCPEVFDITRKPWIDISKAGNPKIWKTVSSCPSGALTCAYNHGIRVEFCEERCCSEAFEGEKKIGECEFYESEDGWVIFHTGVLPEYNGQGIGKRLVFKVLEAAKKSRISVRATCSYALKVIRPTTQ